MRLLRLSIENFRAFEKFTIDLQGESRFLIGENAIGKSSLISAIARALGIERTFQRSDFQDLTKAIEISVTIGDLDPAQIGILHECADFGPTTTLAVGVQVIWDSDAEECEISHGYPTRAWRKSKPAERETIDVHWISDNRDAGRMLQFGTRRGVLAEVLGEIEIADPIATAISEIQDACSEFAAAKDLSKVLMDAGAQMSRLVPGVSKSAFAIESAATTELAVLRQLQLALQHAGPSLPITHQSSGLAELALFSFSLLSIIRRPGSILLIDEPERSLHAHVQRALVRVLQELPNQFVVSTHSASLLDRADPRKIVRLCRDAAAIRDARPSALTNDEANNLKRYMTSQNAEALFARKAILVEGISDHYAIEALATRKAKNIDAAGVSIVVLAGASSINNYLALLGPKGLRVRLAGLADVSDEARWSKALEANGLGANLDRAGMAKIGFHICDPDLEGVLIAALGNARTIQVIHDQGDNAAFERFCKQPAHSGKSLQQQLHDFIHGRNVEYAMPLVDALDLTKVPAPLEGVLNEI
jgi:predicted ATPase